MLRQRWIIQQSCPGWSHAYKFQTRPDIVYTLRSQSILILQFGNEGLSIPILPDVATHNNANVTKQCNQFLSQITTTISFMALNEEIEIGQDMATGTWTQCMLHLEN